MLTAQKDPASDQSQTVAEEHYLADEHVRMRSGKTSMAFANVTTALSDFGSNLRYHAVRAVPTWLVNNSSNILGAAHVYTEILMTKSSIKPSTPGGQALLVEGVSPFRNPIGWTWKALAKIYGDSIKGAFSVRDKGINLWEGNPVKNIWKFVSDTEAATLREWEAQKAANPLLERKDLKLGNNWQTRSTLAGLTVWGLSTFIPDKKESDEQLEKMEIMRRVKPVSYVGERLRQAVWFPEWPQHKRQMIGLGIFISGICSLLGSARNRSQTVGVDPKYIFRKDALGTAIFTFISAFPLLFARDDQRGFSGFGTLMMGRLFFLPGAIKGKLNTGDGGKWYAGASVAFQAENMTQALIGGAEVKEEVVNGVKKKIVIDHSELDKQAAAQAKQVKLEKLAQKQAVSSETPSNKVANVSQREMAMPDRVMAQDQQASAVSA